MSALTPGRITVRDSYGDDQREQHIETCQVCGALVFVEARYPGGGTLDSRAFHQQWHAAQAVAS